MKKMVAVICMVLVFMSGISLMAYAVNKDKTTMNVDLTQRLTVNKDNNLGYKAKFEYIPGGISPSFAYGASRSSVYLNAGQYGYAASTTTAQNGQSQHRYWRGQATTAGYYYSPYAVVSDQKYAEQLYFYGDFRASVNSITAIYELYCE